MQKLTGSPAQRKGNRYEALACRYLQNAGLKLVTRNYRARCGEIDLIFHDGGTLVFVEVRFRTDPDFGMAFETVTFYKQQRIKRTALLYLQANRLTDKIPCRFDVVGINRKGSGLNCRWIKSAFS
ncbi:MAG: YraN family protein [Pseudohongiellaceae bacterium]